jgi:hypothetical protein
MTKVVQNISKINSRFKKPPPLGNVTSYSAKTDNQKVKLTEKELAKKKHDYKKHNIELKKKVGKKVPRVSYCGTRPIHKHSQFIEAVQGEQGGVYYKGMQRCGSVWFCPDCMYKLMKVRADELYKQLKAYKDQGEIIIFITFTLQHKFGDSLETLHKNLIQAFNYANSHRSWIEAKKTVPVEFLRTLEVLYGSNGPHPHIHAAFVANPELVSTINIFVNLYKQSLLKQGLIVNEHTVIVEPWNGKLDDMKDYLFKGMLEKELTGGGLKKSGHGKTFFELIDDGTNQKAIDEYITVMKGKRQYHHSKNFFKDVRVKTDSEIITDDKIDKVLFVIPVSIYSDMMRKGIALHLLNEYVYGGIKRAIRLLELYDVDTGFIENST